MEIVTKYPPVREEQILTLLQEFDAEFVPRLSQRTDLPAYASRLAEHAVWIFAYENGVMTGHCAVYEAEGLCVYQLHCGKEGAAGQGNRQPALETDAGGGACKRDSLYRTEGV